MLTYVVFCRLDGLQDLAADGLAASVGGLAQAVKEACAACPSGPLPSHSSVYGRFVLGTTEVQVALDLALDLLRRATEAGVRVTLGVTCGEAESTPDLGEHNYTGSVVNRAARLACVPNGEHRIAVEEGVVKHALLASDRNKNCFADARTTHVKRTALAYRLLRHEAFPPGQLAVGPDASAELAHVVVYDIVAFSALKDTKQRAAVRNLNDAVEHAFGEVGGKPSLPSEERWYAPAGDGGAVVFHPNRGGGAATAWAFAKALVAQASEQEVPLRVAATTGLVVVLGDNLPVGPGVIEADSLSAICKDSEIHVNRSFWEEHLTNANRTGWVSEAVADNEAGLRLSKANQSHHPKFEDPKKLTDRPWILPGSIVLVCSLIAILTAVVVSYLRGVPSGSQPPPTEHLNEHHRVWLHGIHALFILGFNFLMWTNIIPLNSTTPCRGLIARGTFHQFVRGWKWLWVAWLASYLLLTGAAGLAIREYPLPRTLEEVLSDVLVVLTAGALFYCFLVLDLPSVPLQDQPARDSGFRKSKWIWWSVGLGILSFAMADRFSWPVMNGFGVGLVGFYAGVAMCFLVGRLDDHWIAAPRWSLAPLYIYALIHTIYPFLNYLPTFWVVVIYLAAFLLKCWFFVVVWLLIRDGNLVRYLNVAEKGKLGPPP